MTWFGRMFARPAAASAAPVPMPMTRQTAPAVAEGELMAMANAILAQARVARGTGSPAGDPTGRVTRLIAGLTPERLAGYLDEFYEGNYRNVAMLWDNMQRGDLVAAPVAEKRLKKIVGEAGKWTVDAIDDSPAAAAQKAFLDRFFSAGIHASHALHAEQHGGLRQAVEWMCDAVPKQYAFLAKAWDGQGDDIRLSLRFVPLWHFRNEQRPGEAPELRYCPNPDSTLSSRAVDPEQWVVACRSRAIMEAVSIGVLLLRQPVQQIARVLEKLGVPNVYGTTTAPYNSPGWQALYSAVSAWIADMPIVMSEGSKLELIEPQMTASGLQKEHIAWCVTWIIVNFCGGELGTVSKGGSGTLAGGAQADDLDDIIRDDCEWLSETVNEQIVRQAIALRFGPEAPVLAKFSVTKPDATDAAADMGIIERAVAIGARVPLSHIHDRFNLPEAEEGDEAVAAPPASSAPAGGGFFGMAEAAPECHHALPRAGRAQAKARPARPRGVRNRGRDLAGLEAAAAAEIRAAYARVAAPYIEAVADSEDARTAALALTMTDADDGAIDDLGEAIARMVFSAAMMGLEPERSDLPAATPAERAAGGAPDSGAPLGSVPRAQAEVTYVPLPFDEARAFWAAKRLIADWADLERLDATWLQARALGFRVAGIASEAMLRLLHADIARAVRGEVGVAQLAREVEDRYSLNPRHAEIVVRTNLQSAYQWGHYQQLTSPAVRESFPIWAFDVIDDQATSDICRPLLGKAYPADHPIWQTLYPPNHYNCRTTVVALSAEEAAEQGFEVGDSWPRDPVHGGFFMPQDGFAGNIGEVALDAIAGGPA